MAEMVVEPTQLRSVPLMRQIGDEARTDREFAYRFHRVGVLSAGVAGGSVKPLHHGVLREVALYGPQEAAEGL